MHRYAHAQINRDADINTHTNRPCGGSWHWDRSKWLMWVFVTGSLRQCGVQLSSLTGVASTPPSPPPHPNTNTQPTCWGTRSARGEIGWGVLAKNAFVYCDGVTAVCVCVCVCLSCPLGNKAAPILFKVEHFKVEWEKRGGWGDFFFKPPAVLLLGDGRSMENAKKRGKPTW